MSLCLYGFPKTLHEKKHWNIWNSIGGPSFITMEKSNGQMISKTHSASTCSATHHAHMSMFMSNRGTLSVTLVLLHNRCQSQLCVPDWHNNSLIPLTWSAFLFSLKLLSGTCPARVSPRPFLHRDTRLICGGASLTQEISNLIPTFSLSDRWDTEPASETVCLVM